MATDLAAVRAGLAASYTPILIDELLEAYTEAKRNFYAGGLRLSAVEGGRFCEAVFRLLQERTARTFTPLGQPLKLAAVPSGAQPDSIRLHIPRALRMVYDIRNKRDAAHLADGIDPNIQDASLVISALDRVLAELVRLHHATSANEAQRIVQDLISRVAPAIQVFDDFLKVLNTKLSAPEHVLVLLYHRGAEGATYDQLHQWVRPKMRSNLRTTLRRLEHDRALIHSNGIEFLITQSGLREVEDRKLLSV